VTTKYPVLRIVAFAAAGLVATFIVVAWQIDHRREPTVRPARLPLAVWVSDALLREHGTAVDQAIRLWNDAAGCVVLTPAVDRAAADVRVSWAWEGVPCGNHRNVQRKSAEATLFQCMAGDEIHVQSIVEARHAMPTLAHELGHALGQLDHDGYGILAVPPGLYVTRADAQALARACREAGR
jgi:hypothetical protein